MRLPDFVSGGQPSLVRLDIEADIEYLVVEGATHYYQATGDGKWLSFILPKLEKSIGHDFGRQTLGPGAGLVKRGFAIDTWDFTYKPGAGTNRRINAETRWQSCTATAQPSSGHESTGMDERPAGRFKGDRMAQRLNDLKAQHVQAHLWNGKFFIHQLRWTGPGWTTRKTSGCRCRIPTP